MVSWYFAPGYRVIGSPYRSSVPLRKVRTMFGKPPYIIHQVRHPLKVISSIQVANIRSINFIKDIIGYNAEEEGYLKFFMYYWLYWNWMAERISVARIRIETFRRDMENVLILTGEKRRVGFLNKGMKLVSKKENSKVELKKYKKQEWGDLLKEDRVLTGAIIDLANRYGYGLNKNKIMEGC